MKAEIILTLPIDTQKLLKPMMGDLKAVTTAKEIKTGSFKVEFA